MCASFSSMCQLVQCYSRRWSSANKVSRACMRVGGSCAMTFSWSGGGGWTRQEPTQCRILILKILRQIPPSLWKLRVAGPVDNVPVMNVWRGGLVWGQTGKERQFHLFGRNFPKDAAALATGHARIIINSLLDFTWHFSPVFAYQCQCLFRYLSLRLFTRISHLPQHVQQSHYIQPIFSIHY